MTHVEGVWTQTQILTLPETADSASLGLKLAISRDNTTLIATSQYLVGASANSILSKGIHVFKNTTGTWTYSSSFYDNSRGMIDGVLLVSIDGSTVMAQVGQRMLEFRLSAGGWVEYVASDKLPTIGSFLQARLSTDGGRLVCGLRGLVRVYERLGEGWVTVTPPTTPPDVSEFGSAVDISDDGETIVTVACGMVVKREWYVPYNKPGEWRDVSYHYPMAYAYRFVEGVWTYETLTTVTIKPVNTPIHFKDLGVIRFPHIGCYLRYGSNAWVFHDGVNQPKVIPSKTWMSINEINTEMLSNESIGFKVYHGGGSVWEHQYTLTPVIEGLSKLTTRGIRTSNDTCAVTAIREHTDNYFGGTLVVFTKG